VNLTNKAIEYAYMGDNVKAEALLNNTLALESEVSKAGIEANRIKLYMTIGSLSTVAGIFLTIYLYLRSNMWLLWAKTHREWIIMKTGGSKNIRDGDTVEIAKSYGAKVFLRKPWGYVEPDRIFALKKASYGWILYLDDDELLGKKLKNELKDLIQRAEERRFVALSTVRINYDAKYRQVLFGSAYPDRQIRIYRKDKVSYRGMVHELPRVFGEILELPEDYYIIHYYFFRRKNIVFYAYLESIEYFQHFTRSKIRKALWKFTPISAPFIIAYHLIFDLMIKTNPYINACTIFRTVDLYSFYEILVHTLTKFRGRRRTKISKLISTYGLIKLLEHEAN
jgi:(heptosyl)LPS beta-1,4-glucosyltransferase